MQITVDIDAGDISAKLDALRGKIDRPRKLFKAMGMALESQAEENFLAQGRPPG